ncbi:hypothetical protein AB4Y45_04660 [Paraburkholderia sp. EG287A]|uniref:hypothetical protein n=1 Tax=unclassified Paraburkholderia TaxID=2615204 RepID=UPI0034D26F51
MSASHAHIEKNHAGDQPCNREYASACGVVIRPGPDLVVDQPFFARAWVPPFVGEPLTDGRVDEIVFALDG